MFRSATKITHKAQAITGLAAKWHVCATLDSFDGADEGGRLSAQISHEKIYPRVGTDGESEGDDDAGDEEDEIDNTEWIASYSYSTISYQKRQALGKILILNCNFLVFIENKYTCLKNYFCFFDFFCSKLLWE